MMPNGDDTEPVSSPRFFLAAMVVSGIVVASGRWMFSSDRRVYHVSPDEPSQLAIARWLAGDRRWNMFDHATWQPLLGTMLSPIYRFTNDGETVVRWALGVNALIAGISAAVLVVLVHRMTALPPIASAAVATLIAIAPSSLSASSFIWAEPLISLFFLATVLALMHWYEADRMAIGILAIVCAVAGFSAHSRLLPLVGTTVLLTVGREAWRRRWPRFVVLGLTTGVLLIASSAWTRWILANVWDDPSDQNTVSAVWRRIQRPLAVADSVLGQTWYQLTATLGVALLGIVVLGRAAIRSRSVPGSPRSSDARVLVVSVAPLLLLSAIFMADRPRPDQFVYGRYNDAVMWPILALGVAWLGRRFRSGWTRRQLLLAATTAVAMLVTGLVVDLRHGDAIRERYGVRGMIAGLLPFVDGDDTLSVWRASLISTALFVALVGLARLASTSWIPRRLGVSIAAVTVTLVPVLLSVAVVRTENVADLRLNGWQKASQVVEVDTLVPAGLPVGVRPVPNSRDPVVEWVPQRQRYMLYQLYLPGRSFVRDRGVDDAVGPYVFAPLGDPEMVEAGAELIWTDPSIRIGLWLEPEVP